MWKGRLSQFLNVLLMTAICSVYGIQYDSVAIAGDQDHQIRPIITTSELVVGSNRFAFGLVRAQRLIDDARVLVRLYQIHDNKGRLVAQVNAPYRRISKLNKQNKVHRHTDGTLHMHTSKSEVRGVYVTQLHFSAPGIWGVELLVQKSSEPAETVRLSVTVSDQALTPTIGSHAPRSRNLIADDVKHLAEIDTSPQPDPRMHRVRIADAIAQGNPQLIVFATPRFCTSRMCGPVVDIIRRLLPAYDNKVAFTHQEIWQDIALKKLYPTVEEWGLYSEPWVFVVDGKGIIRAKFEGLVTEEEIEEALQKVLTDNSPPRS